MKEDKKHIEELEKIFTERRQKHYEKLNTEIDYRKNLIEQKRKEIKNLNYEIDLIENNLVSTIVNGNLEYNLPITEKHLHKTWLFSIKHNTSKENEEIYNYTINLIKEKILLNNENFIINKVYMSTGEQHHYTFQYKYKTKTFNIEIPIFSLTNKENLGYMILGYKVYLHNEYYMDLIINDLNFENLAQKLKKYLEENIDVD